LRHEETVVARGADLGAAFLSPPSTSVVVAVREGEPIDVRFEFVVDQGGPVPGALAVTVGIGPDLSDPDGLLAAAVDAAMEAEVAVVVVGTNAKVESEGYDRTTLSLPGRQDELVTAVAAANPRTVVVVNSGSPDLLPWRDDVAAVVLSWFGGQEYGAALADILFGVAEPGGRLPTTWPATQDDVPVIDVTPVDGVVRYSEGIHIGYRAWLKSGREPAYEFGHGMGYTSWDLTDLTLSADTVTEGGSVRAQVRLVNTGDRAGKQVVQVYLARPRVEHRPAGPLARRIRCGDCGGGRDGHRRHRCPRQGFRRLVGKGPWLALRTRSVHAARRNQRLEASAARNGDGPVTVTTAPEPIRYGGPDQPQGLTASSAHLDFLFSDNDFCDIVMVTYADLYGGRGVSDRAVA